LTPSLPGRRVLVTRAAHQAGKLSAALRALGFEPVEVPVLEIHPPEDCTVLDAALHQLSSYDWLILTSANTVRSLADRAAALGLNLGDYTGKVAAIGEATATAAREAGLTVTLVPESYVAESLVASLKNQTTGKRMLIARAAIARDIIPDALRDAGATVDVVHAYRNAIPNSAPAQLRQALKQGIDAATFTSSSSVTHLAAVAKQAGIAFPFANVPAISIGPITTQTLLEHNWPPAAEATQSDIQGLAAAVKKLFY